jgi:hypothetical protein
LFGRKRHIGEERATGFALLRLVYWIGGVVIVLPAVIVMALHLPFVQRVVIVELVRTIERTSGFVIEFKSYSWQPFSSLRIMNLKVASPGEKIVECDEVRLTYGLAFKWPYFLPKEAYLVRPLIHLERDAGGQWQIPGNSQRDRKDGSGGIPASWARIPWPQVYVSSGAIDARQGGRSILSIKEINGVLPIRMVSGADGPKLRIELGQWGG